MIDLDGNGRAPRYFEEIRRQMFPTSKGMKMVAVIRENEPLAAIGSFMWGESDDPYKRAAGWVAFHLKTTRKGKWRVVRVGVDSSGRPTQGEPEIDELFETRAQANARALAVMNAAVEPGAVGLHEQTNAPLALGLTAQAFFWVVAVSGLLSAGTLILLGIWRPDSTGLAMAIIGSACAVAATGLVFARYLWMRRQRATAIQSYLAVSGAL